jgi:glycosyltransferase involved in cell wall biosynthesis
MRGAGVHFASDERWSRGYDLVLASSYLPLVDLLALRPELNAVPRVLYFHENQLAYPMRPEFSGERDLHYGFTQLVSARAATACWFNSRWNLESFLDAGRRLLDMMPDAKCPGWIEAIADKSRVMPLPLDLPVLAPRVASARGEPPLIVWNHRWEYDKGPAHFFEGLNALMDANQAFRVAVVGESFRKVPPCFEQGRRKLEASPHAQIHQWGFVESREEYWALLREADIAVSTAQHEFFGISMLEAAHAGARVLVPNHLSYPELFHPSVTYPPDDFGGALLRSVMRPVSPEERRQLSQTAAPYAAPLLLPRYAKALEALLES